MAEMSMIAYTYEFSRANTRRRELICVAAKSANHAATRVKKVVADAGILLNPSSLKLVGTAAMSQNGDILFSTFGMRPVSTVDRRS